MSNLQFCEYIVAVIIIIASIGIYLSIWYFRKGKKQIEIFSNAHVALLRSQMLDICKDCKEKNHTTPDELSTFNSLYKAYKSSGFNGLGDKLYNDMQKLEVSLDK